MARHGIDKNISGNLAGKCIFKLIKHCRTQMRHHMWRFTRLSLLSFNDSCTSEMGKRIFNNDIHSPVGNLRTSLIT